MTDPIASPAAPAPDAVVAWRCRSEIETEWDYGPKKLAKNDYARKDPGFEEQPLYIRPAKAVKPIGYIFQPHGAAADKWDYSHGAYPDISQGAFWIVKPVYADLAL